MVPKLLIPFPEVVPVEAIFPELVIDPIVLTLALFMASTLLLFCIPEDPVPELLIEEMVPVEVELVMYPINPELRIP